MIKALAIAALLFQQPCVDVLKNVMPERAEPLAAFFYFEYSGIDPKLVDTFPQSIGEAGNDHDVIPGVKIIRITVAGSEEPFVFDMLGSLAGENHWSSILLLKTPYSRLPNDTRFVVSSRCIDVATFRSFS